MKSAQVVGVLVAFVASSAVLMAAGQVYVAYRYQPPPRLVVNQRVDDPVLSQAVGVKPWVDDTGINTSSWKTFGNEALGFWVRYPPSWYVTSCLGAESGLPFVVFSSKPSPLGFCDQGFSNWQEGTTMIVLERRFAARPGEWPRTSKEKAFYREEFFSLRGQPLLWIDVASEARGEEGEELPGRPLRYWTSVNFQTIDRIGHYEASIGGRLARDQLLSIFSSEQHRRFKALIGSLRWQ